MTVIEKRFSFMDDTEGWTAVGLLPDGQGGYVEGEPVAVMGWRRLNHPRLDSPAWLARGGCLRATSRSGNGCRGFWRWSGPWTALGVPAGTIVTAVQAEFLCRWQMGKHRHFPIPVDDEVYFATNDAWSGPLLLDEAALTPAVTAPGRSEGEQWYSYPVGPSSYEVWVQTDPPQGWLVVQGETLTLGSAQPAEATISLALHYGLPGIPEGRYRSLRLKQNEIVLQITYVVPAKAHAVVQATALNQARGAAVVATAASVQLEALSRAQVDDEI